MTNLPTRLADYRPHPYHIQACRLHFRLDPAHTTVSSTLTIHSQTADRPPLVLDGESLNLVSVTIDGIETIPEVTNTHLKLPGFIGTQTVQIETIISPQTNTALEGLYWVKGTFCTQNEPEGFRKITYFIDRPDNLTQFTTIIDAVLVDYPTLLSNGNLIDQAHLPDGYHRTVWSDPFPKPCYLFALVAGKFDVIPDTFITQSGRRVTLEIYSDPGNGTRCHYAMDALKRSMKWDEDQYACEYDLDRFMIVAIDSFNMGAMENKGLNIFNSAYILADPKTATDADYMNIEAVVAHEYFHNWTGNRVTCRDWFQLTLKEGLTVYRDQEFSSDMNSRGVKRISDVRTLKEVQFTEDSGPMAHPIQPKQYLEINNFYTATVYNKGAEVIRMMATLAGNTVFRSGVTHYLRSNDGRAATTEDFIQAIERTSALDLTQFRNWYHQAGTPQISITPESTNPTHHTWTLSQSGRPSPDGDVAQPLVIPIRIGMISKATGQPVPFRVNNAAPCFETVFPFSNHSDRLSFVTDEPTVPSILRGLSAPVTVEFPYTQADLLTLFTYDVDPVNRFDAGQQLYERLILSAYHNQPEDPQPIIEALNQLLRSEEDPAVIAMCLQLPTLNRLVDIVPKFDIVGVSAAKEKLTQTIRTHLYPILKTVYDTTRTTQPYHPTATQIGCRRLNAAVLHLLSDHSDEADQRLARHYNDATNMTDQLAALTIATSISAPCSDRLLEAFHDTWNHDSNLVMKWLNAQSSAIQGDTQSRVEQLRGHASYHLKIPNQFRALVGGFSNNLLHFHNPTGKGYEWVADRLIEIDPINPQIAARIALSFQKAGQADPDRLQKIDAALSRVLSVQSISKNLFEVVSRIKQSYNLGQ